MLLSTHRRATVIDLVDAYKSMWRNLPLKITVFDNGTFDKSYDIMDLEGKFIDSCSVVCGRTLKIICFGGVTGRFVDGFLDVIVKSRWGKDLISN